MKIIRDKLTIVELGQIASNVFGDMVKAVVDVEREIVALDAELHSDLEALLLENASKQNSLWGVNLYPELKGDHFIEFDSMINMRPSQNNRSRSVENQDLQKKIRNIIQKRIVQ